MTAPTAGVPAGPYVITSALSPGLYLARMGRRPTWTSNAGRARVWATHAAVVRFLSTDAVRAYEAAVPRDAFIARPQAGAR